MKTILVNILAILVIVGLALPTVGGTLATWSDSETSYGNYIETGSLDLLVARCDADWENPGPFRDDPPWGGGLDPCFDIPELELDETYACYLLLWNAGCVDGVAYLHIKNVPENNPLAASTTMQIWYDDDGDPTTPVVEVERDTIADLDCNEIELGLLPGEAERHLKLEIHPYSASAGDSLRFDIVFQLVQRELLGPTYAWADTEQNSSYLGLTELGGTPEFWSGAEAVTLYGKPKLVSWFRTIVRASAWYKNDLATGSDDEVYDKMVNILDNVGGGDYTGRVNQFRSQYLATRLNTMPDPPRLQPGITHDISGITGAEAYFGYGSGTLGKIMATIESKVNGAIFTEPPSKDEMIIMNNVCDRLNKLQI